MNGPTTPRRGRLVVLSAPSGAGKTTLVKALVAAHPDLRFSISYTTRPARPGEEDGRDYFFVDEPRFLAMIGAGEFLEHALVFGNRYGTSRSQVDGLLARGHDVLLEIDWQGAQQVRALFPEAVSIFILPPSFEALAQRLTGRGSDAPEVIERRLAAAREEIGHLREFDFVIINNILSQALDEMVTVARAARLLRSSQMSRHPEFFQSLGVN